MSSTVATSLRAGWALAGRSIRLQVKEHMFGYAWTLIIPVLYAVCFILVKQAIDDGQVVRTQSDHWRSVLRAFAGVTLFQCWMQVLQDMAELIRRQRVMLKGMAVDVAPFALAVMLEGGVSLLVRAATIVVAVPLVGLSLPGAASDWLWFALALSTLLLSAAAIGLVLTPWAALYGDVRKALRSLYLPIVLISPIFYPAVNDKDLPLYWINLVNPLAPPLAVVSDALAGNDPSYGMAVVIWLVLSLLILSKGVVQVRRQIPVLLERMGS